MARHYDSFEKLKEKVSDTYGNIAMLLEKFDWDFFSEDGQNKIEAYAILDENFTFSTNLKELAQNISGEIIKLKKERDNATPEDAAEKTEVIKLLAKYIRHNLDEEIWKDFPEFDKKHARGC